MFDRNGERRALGLAGVAGTTVAAKERHIGALRGRTELGL